MPSEYKMWFQYAQDHLKYCHEWKYAFFEEIFTTSFVGDFRSPGLQDLKVYNYKLCETSIACTHEGQIDYHDEALLLSLGCWFPAQNYAIYICNKQLNSLPVEVPREILVGGAGVASGYVSLDETNKQKFFSNKFSKPGSNLTFNGWAACIVLVTAATSEMMVLPLSMDISILTLRSRFEV
jgi:hybrid polyketide synthase/nonribosomal peptide synthetase ACE1